jgi:NIPSNAP protein
MLYELRHYIPVTGKEKAILDRFNDHTLGIFKRLGIKVSDFWLEANESGHLWYVVDWDSKSQMDSTWDIFRADPAWIKARDESEATGPIVEKIEVILLNRLEHPLLTRS